MRNMNLKDQPTEKFMFNCRINQLETVNSQTNRQPITYCRTEIPGIVGDHCHQNQQPGEILQKALHHYKEKEKKYITNFIT